MKNVSCFLIVLALSYTSIYASDLIYEVDLTKSKQNVFNIKFHINNIGDRDSIKISMASWTPGSYMIREFVQHLYNEQAYHNSVQLNTKKKNKNTWLIETKGHSSLTFEYSIYAHELSVRQSYINDDFALINGASVFVYVLGRAQEESDVKFILPEGWDNVSTTLKKPHADNFIYTSSDLDELIDSPILIGTHEAHVFSENGVNHTIAITGPPLYNLKKMEDDFRKIIRTQTQIFEDNPNKDYIFFIINHNAGGGGLEHKSACVVIVDRFAYTRPSSYESFLSLIAHEYFHLWNVKRIRPIELGPFDYNSENYTSLLWIMEGFTEYFTEKTLYRIGVINENVLLANINDAAQYCENRPGNEIQSLGESSFDTWVKFYRRSENDVNTEVSYYKKGLLAGAMLDLKIIADTKGEKSLEDVMKELYETYYKSLKRGFTKEEFINTIEKVTNSDYRQFIEDHIYDTKAFNYDKLLSPLGIDVTMVKLDDNSFGFYARPSSNGYTIVRIINGSPANIAGLNVNDDLIAIEGYRFSTAKESYFEQKLGAGETVKFTIMRDDMLKEVLLKPSSAKSTVISFEIKSEQTKNEKILWTTLLNK